MKNLLLIIGSLAFIFGLIPYLFMKLWNYVMPYLFKLPEINFLMSLAIIFIFSMLFKSNK